MRPTRLALLVWLLCVGCSDREPESTSSTPAIDSAHFAVLETELSPATLVHSRSKYLGLFADTEPPSHIALSTRGGPRSFRRGQKLNAAELEECWLLLWGPNLPPWVVYLQHRPLALTLDTNALHFSFANGAGNVVLLPLHGSSTNVATKQWPEFLLREPLMRIRYWASALREFPIECQTSVAGSNVHQSFRFHSIRDDWKTKPLKLAPMSPPLAVVAGEPLKRKLRDLEMPTPFGPYMGFEGVAEWSADFPMTITGNTNCAWASFGDCGVSRPNTVLIHPVQTNGWPRLASCGKIKAVRDQLPSAAKQTLLNANSRLISYDLNSP